MGFLSVLRGYFADRSRPEPTDEAMERFRAAWGLAPEEADNPGVASPGPDADAPSAFDKTQWRRKLHHIFERFPASSGEWPALMREARALGLDAGWIAEGMGEEFTMMVRGLIADRRLTQEEQDRLEAARTLIGLSEEEAAALVRDVVEDAERFFGGGVIVDP